MWVSFADKAAFVAYHDQACADRGIPKPGQIQATGIDALGNQWTTAWVRPVDDSGVLKAFVPDEDVATYGLTPSTPAGTPSKPTWDGECDKTLPATWNGKPVPRPVAVTKDG